tara:strand:- start:88 stop:627 length:540 start_codon:yes stop_codon:yes gene_type:complete
VAWDNTLVNRLRYYIGDIDGDSQVWSNIQLAKMIAISAVDVLSEVSLIDTSFDIDTDIPSITPDPTSNDLNAGIGALFVLRSAYVIALSEMRKDISKFGFRIRDDKTSIDGSVGMGARKEMLEFYKDNYTRGVWEWEKGNRAACRAILGPYSSADNPQFPAQHGHSIYYARGNKQNPFY